LTVELEEADVASKTIGDDPKGAGTAVARTDGEEASEVVDADSVVPNGSVSKHVN
jgi:hypothetical protein